MNLITKAQDAILKLQVNEVAFTDPSVSGKLRQKFGNMVTTHQNQKK